MQNYFKTESPLIIVFDNKIETVPGGITLAVKDLTQKRVSAGTPAGKDSNGLYHVTKTARINTAVGEADKSINVDKKHNFKVGDILACGSKGYAITKIDQSNAGYDAITVPTALGAIAVGEVVFEGDKAGDDGVKFKYSPVLLTGTTMDVIEGDNHLVDGVVRGSVREAAIDAAISEEIKKLLPLIRFV